MCWMSFSGSKTNLSQSLLVGPKVMQHLSSSRSVVFKIIAATSPKSPRFLTKSSNCHYMNVLSQLSLALSKDLPKVKGLHVTLIKKSLRNDGSKTHPLQRLTNPSNAFRCSMRRKASLAELNQFPWEWDTPKTTSILSSEKLYRT